MPDPYEGRDIRDALGNPMDQNNNFVAGEVPADRFTGTFAIAPTYTAQQTTFEDRSIVGLSGTFPINGPVNLGSNTLHLYGISYTGNNQLYASGIRSHYTGRHPCVSVQHGSR